MVYFLRVMLVVLCVFTPTFTALAESSVSSSAATTSSPDDNIELQAPQATVTVWGVPIITLRASYRDKTPELRATTIKQHILNIPFATDYAIELVPGSLGSYSGAWVLVNGIQTFAIMDGDVPNNVTMAEFGEATAAKLQLWLERRQAQQSPKVLLNGLLHSGVATAIFFTLMIVTLKGRQFTQKRLDGLYKIKSARQKVQLGGIELVPYLIMLASGAVRVLTFFMMALFFYLWLTYVLSQFPYTQGTGNQLAQYIVSIVSDIAAAMVNAIPELIMVIIIFWLAKTFNNIITNIFSRIESGRLRSTLFDPETAKATRRVITLMIWIFSVIIAYPYIPGSQTEAFKGVSVFLGLMVSLGSAGMVSQVIGGLIVVYSRAFQAGEYVRIGEHEGTVLVVGVLSTKIRTLKQEEISIPNAVLLNQSSTNYSRISQDDGLVISTTVTIGYDTPWRQVHELLLAAANRCEGIRKTPKPNILQIALSDWYVEYRLNVHIDNPSLRLKTLTLLHEAIQDAFSSAQVQIMSPHFVAQPETAVLPAEPRQEATPTS